MFAGHVFGIIILTETDSCGVVVNVKVLGSKSSFPNNDYMIIY